MRLECRAKPVAQVIRISGVVDVLKLAPTALRIVTAWWIDVMRAERQRTIIE